MKKRIIIVGVYLVLVMFIILGLGKNIAFGNEFKEKKSNIISISLTQLPKRILDIAYEKTLKPDFSIEIEGAIKLSREYVSTLIGGLVKEYPGSTAPLGFWYGGGIDIAFVYDQYGNIGISPGFSGNGGYKHSLGDITLELNLGISFSPKIIIISHKTNFSFDIFPTGRIRLGYVF